MVQFIATFIVLAILGLVDTLYLVYQHYKKKPLICPVDHDCSVVTESKWNKIFFVRNDILGLLFYIGLLVAILITIFSPNLIPNLYLLITIATGLGLLGSIFLVYIQLYVIKDYCFYCMVSAIINLLLFVNSVGLLVRI